jgi:hypothetical protein
MSTTPVYMASPFDHGFEGERGTRRAFEDLDYALVYCVLQPGQGRHTSFTGRCTQDITWMVRDPEGKVHAPQEWHHRVADVARNLAALHRLDLAWGTTRCIGEALRRSDPTLDGWFP